MKWRPISPGCRRTRRLAGWRDAEPLPGASGAAERRRNGALRRAAEGTAAGGGAPADGRAAGEGAISRAAARERTIPAARPAKRRRPGRRMPDWEPGAAPCRACIVLCGVALSSLAVISARRAAAAVSPAVVSGTGNGCRSRSVCSALGRAADAQQRVPPRNSRHLSAHHRLPPAHPPAHAPTAHARRIARSTDSATTRPISSITVYPAPVRVTV